MKRLTLFAIMVMLGTFGARAATTKVFREKSFNDFLKGELKSTSLSNEGKLFPAPAAEKVAEAEEGLIWRIITRPDGALFFSTGNEGKIFICEKGKKAQVYCDLEEVAAFALALDSKGVLYAGASPGGKIYKIAQKDKPEVFFETKQEYIWDLLFNAEGHLFAATGSEGKVFRIGPKGTGDIYFETPEKHIMDIMFLSQPKDSGLFLATQDKGRIYRVHDKDKAFVLYDSGADEVRALAEGADGFIYAALNTGKGGAGGPSQPTLPAQLMEMIKKESPSGDEDSGDSGESEPAPQLKLGMPMISGKKSTIIKMDISGYVWPMLDAPEAPIHCLAYDSTMKTLLAGAGEKGKLYRVDDLNKFSALLSADEKYILSMASAEGGFYYGTGETAVIYSLNWKDRSKGEYISSAQDAGSAVKWGLIRIDADIPSGTSIKYATRSGNTNEPDKSWSDWSKEEMFKNKQGNILSPVARFLQYKLLLTGRNEAIYPVLQEVTAYYIPPNRAPIIEQIEVAKEGKAQPSPRQMIMMMMNKDKPEGSKPDQKPGGAPSESGASTDAKANSNPQKVKISWKVNDPEGDQMRFELQFKGEDETVWKKIEDKLDKSNFDLSTAALPDGRYRIKVIASDLPSNPKSSAMESELISEVFVVDNTPPKWTEEISYKAVDKNSIMVKAGVEDKSSIIASAQYSINAGDWYVLFPEDEIFDAEKENFSFLIKDLDKEEAAITLQVTDAEGNTLVGKVLVIMKKK
ncbi:MAG TPA: hypothetical protein PKW18_04505 [Candidatus Sumerlaeota bacterium]|nr:MAG: hypothetical protein BWY12_01416 [candidate division BRC1 bacterium ADurb.Bin183]HOE64725.1 hypothetical protein [Candidatus Sumerlaeota bacterium]HRR30037.1 hypothetical protein [Candidatus Sumerlaeia bacterium]HON51235.1 hypothetical protein [Candidatus Sumerlaeota bacterium]HOR64448.1 hypothetical protein [Candidatus Sumerlaeota bacterium]